MTGESHCNTGRNPLQNQSTPYEFAYNYVPGPQTILRDQWAEHGVAEQGHGMNRFHRVLLRFERQT